MASPAVSADEAEPAVEPDVPALAKELGGCRAIPAVGSPHANELGGCQAIPAVGSPYANELGGCRAGAGRVRTPETSIRPALLERRGSPNPGGSPWLKGIPGLTIGR